MYRNATIFGRHECDTEDGFHRPNGSKTEQRLCGLMCRIDESVTVDLTAKVSNIVLGAVEANTAQGQRHLLWLDGVSLL